MNTSARNDVYEGLKNLMKDVQNCDWILSFLMWEQFLCWKSLKDHRSLVKWWWYNKFVTEYTQALLQNVLEDYPADSIQHKNALIIQRDYNRLRKLWKAFLKQLEEVSSTTYDYWVKAKDKNDFGVVLPYFEEIISLKRHQVELLWYDKNGWHPYDVLIQEFEPWFSTAQLDVLFSELKLKLLWKVNKLSNSWISIELPAYYIADSTQEQFMIQLLKDLWFDMSSLLLWRTSQWICYHIWKNDVRFWISYDSKNILRWLYAWLHEWWHAKYFLWLNPQEYWMPSGSRVWYGMHESQSRFYEIMLWKNIWFIRFLLSRLKKNFVWIFETVSDQDLYKYLNSINPWALRIPADEITYQFHIIIRYELEKWLIDWSIQPKDLPIIWKQKYKEYLWVEIKDDNSWILQDVQWFLWWIWNFPVYSLGTLYAAQFYYSLRKHHPDFDEKVARWDFKFIDNWFSGKLYKNWRLYNAQEICEKMTWEKLNVDYFIKLISERFGI